jgi:hypothetical protein
MSSKDSYQFNIVNDQVTAAYELEHGRWERESLHLDELYFYANGVVTKIEPEDGQFEATQYTDLDGDGIYQKSREWKLPASSLDNLQSFENIVLDSVDPQESSSLAENESELNETYLVNGVVYSETADDLYVDTDGSVLLDTEETNELNKTYLVNSVVYSETADDLYVGNLVKHENGIVKHAKHWKSKAEIDDIYQLGDGNIYTAEFSNNGRSISASDALSALKLAVGIADQDSSDVYQYIAADVNKDGRVSASDALTILKMALGLDVGVAPEYIALRVDSDGEYSENAYRESISRDHINWEQINLGKEGLSDSSELVGLVLGDVNGSWNSDAVIQA